MICDANELKILECALTNYIRDASSQLPKEDVEKLNLMVIAIYNKIANYKPSEVATNAPTYTETELKILVDMGKVYTVNASQQLQPAEVNTLIGIIGNLLNKITNNQSSEKLQVKPNGISDEWFDNVCKSCNNYKNGNCNDQVAIKFPGKCDPILHYEVKKIKK